MILNDSVATFPKAVYAVKVSYKKDVTVIPLVGKTRKTTMVWQYATRAAAVKQVKRLLKMQYKDEPVVDVELFESSLEWTKVEGEL